MRRIGVGGMGEVWEADDTVLGRRVALKVLVQELADDPRATRRFVREARATAKLTHPNVTRVYDFGRDGGLPYLVMELLEGDTLADRLAGGPLPPSEAARIGAAVADALDVAHSRGIVHRDIKPSNVLLTPAGEVKVMDFGIAAAADETHSTTGSGLYGTAAYISPERAAGQAATPATDVYSLGAVLYELLIGRPPFLGDSPVLVVRAHLHERPRPVRELAPWVPARLADACEAALAKDPAQRPSSAAALAMRLRAAPFRPGAPVPGSGEAPTTRLRPPRRRDPARRQRPADPTRVIAAAPAGSAIATTVKMGAGRAIWRRHRRRTVPLLVGTLVVVLAALAVMELRGGDQPAQAPAATATAAAPQVRVTLQATALVWTRITV
ncbi:MAG TPA: serine/threonine-protein kinase, partial [Actinomycetota bacterium]|nr:serine/threonine-protein kinase [Actinomycetota bacterium]